MGKNFKHILAADLLALGLAASSVPATAGEVTDLRVVVHVVDYASVPRGRMAFVQKLVTGVYRQAGVKLTFEGSPLPGASEPGVLDLQVTFLSAAMTEEKCRTDGLADTIYGSAIRAARRAYVFYERAVSLETTTKSLPAIVLATVLAHEIGHLLLPEGSHSQDGLMRAKWFGSMKAVPGFNRRQMTQMRERLQPPTEMVAR